MLEILEIPQRRDRIPTPVFLGFPDGSDPPVMWENWVQSLGGEDPLEKGMATHSVFLPGELHGQRIPVGYHQ